MDTNHKKVVFHPFVKMLGVCLRHDCGVGSGAHVLVGVSGGADSVGLLRGLAVVGGGRKWGLRLSVGHVQHHLRAEAEGDADFVCGLAGELGLDYVRRDVDVLGAGGNMEEAGRELRYEALGEMAGEVGAGFVAVGHHGDDQVETLLMRMLRGSGLRGMGGMAYVRGLSGDGGVKLIRPLLGHDGGGVREFLTFLGQDWREDVTNGDLGRTRARLRHDVLPVLRDLKGDMSGRVNDLAGYLRDVDGLVVELGADLLARARVGDVLSRAVLAGGHEVVLFEAMRLWLVGRGVSFTGADLRRLVKGIGDGRGGERMFGAVGIRGVWVE